MCAKTESEMRNNSEIHCLYHHISHQSWQKINDLFDKRYNYSFGLLNSASIFSSHRISAHSAISYTSSSSRLITQELVYLRATRLCATRNELSRLILCILNQVSVSLTDMTWHESHECSNLTFCWSLNDVHSASLYFFSSCACRCSPTGLAFFLSPVPPHTKSVVIIWFTQKLPFSFDKLVHLIFGRFAQWTCSRKI